jgi:hypothetical protein
MPAIHAAILSAMSDISKTGIAKASKNKDQNYQFRGIEAAMNEMSVILIRNGITIEPKYSDRTVVDHPTKSGGMMHFASVKGVFKFEAADGSSISPEFYGEGSDVSDKATTKAQSVAFRTALFQTFVVPTMAMDPEDDAGEETVSPEVQALLDNAEAAARKGIDAYQTYFKSITKEDRVTLGPWHEEFKELAAGVQ